MTSIAYGEIVGVVPLASASSPIRVLPLAALVALVTVLSIGRWRGTRSARSTPSLATASAAASNGAGALDAATIPALEASIGAGAPPAREPTAGVPTSFHAGASHANRAAGTGPSRPELVWSTDVGGAVEAQPIASSDGHYLYIATLSGELRSLVRADGHLAWKVDLGGRAYATPLATADGTIYAGSDGHRVIALGADGSVRWRLEVPGEVDTAFVALPGPAAGDIAFAAGRNVYAVHPNGVVAWRFGAGAKVFSAPAIAGSHVVFGAQDNHAYAVALDGKLAWSVDLGADVDGSPAVTDDGDAIFGTDGGAIVRVGRAGKIAWKTALDGFVRGGLSIARNGDVLAGMYGPTPAVVRLDARDGHLIGRFGVEGTGAREFGVHGAPLEDDRGALFFGTQDDRVYAIGPDGARMWTVTRGGDIDAPLTLLPNGDLIVASDDGTVAMYRDKR